MGYAIMMAPCITCAKPFTFHPHKVPSVRVEGTRRPVCRDCMDRANAIRKERGMELLPIMDGAYEPAEEGEL